MSQIFYPLRVTLTEPHLAGVVCAARTNLYVAGEYRTACDAGYDAETLQAEHDPAAPVTCWRCKTRMDGE